MGTAADKDPVLAALPAEVRERVERALDAYGKEDGPAEAANLFPEQPLPGETIAVDLWDEDGAVAFRARVGDKVVLDRGRAILA